MRHPRIRAATLATTVAVVIAALIVPPQAAAAPAAMMDSVWRVGAGSADPADLPAALRRDLGLTDDLAAQAQADAEAARVAQQLQAELGTRSGGAWLAGGRLVVAITNPADAGLVRAAGADAELVRHTEQELDAVMGQLNRAAPAPAPVTGWYVDLVANTVVVEVLTGARPAAEEFIEASGVDDALIQIDTVAEPPRPALFPLREGDPYFPGNARCTIGFLVFTAERDLGFLTAGHCGSRGTLTRGFNMQPQGAFEVSVFPGLDVGLVLVGNDWFPDPITAGNLEAPIGAVVCRTGSTTGTHCGHLIAKNQTVVYPQGTVFGLSRTNVCAEPGDSGGPFFAGGNHGQGMLSGGSGNCSFGGISFFQPLNPVLSAFNLTLITT